MLARSTRRLLEAPKSNSKGGLVLTEYSPPVTFGDRQRRSIALASEAAVH
jgi:hypothetical protein